MTEVRPEWLLEYAPQYFDLSNTRDFPPNTDVRRALERVINKVSF